MSGPLHLAVDARVVASDVRGIGRYERAVLRRLLVRDDVAVTLLIPELFPALRRGALERALGSDRFTLARRVPRRTGVTWFPANGTFFTSHAPVVATVHDAVPFRYPNDDPRAREREQAPFLRTVATARAFIAVSEFGKDELCEVFGIARERVHVIHHGVDAAFSPGEPGSLPAGLHPGGYLLFIGDPSEPRKNFSLLYAAYRAAWPGGGGPALVVAGTARAPHPDVIVTDRMGGDLRSDAADALRDLYRGARAVVVPSYHETFGMPVIEAMACGTPVLACAGSSISEVAGHAAYLLPPDDAAAWTRALREVARDDALRARLCENGLRRAAHFRWETSTQAHLDVFRAVAQP